MAIKKDLSVVSWTWQEDQVFFRAFPKQISVYLKNNTSNKVFLEGGLQSASAIMAAIGAIGAKVDIRGPPSGRDWSYWGLQNDPSMPGPSCHIQG